MKPSSKKLKTLAELQRYFLDHDKPNKFDPYEKDNVLMQTESTFEDICNTMEDQGSASPKRLSEYEFYQKLKYYEKKFKAMTDASKQV